MAWNQKNANRLKAYLRRLAAMPWRGRRFNYWSPCVDSVHDVGCVACCVQRLQFGWGWTGNADVINIQDFLGCTWEEACKLFVPQTRYVHGVPAIGSALETLATIERGYRRR